MSTGASALPLFTLVFRVLEALWGYRNSHIPRRAAEGGGAVWKSVLGEFAFLSNFHPVEGGIEYEGVSYPTVENVQAAKTLDPEERTQFEACTPAQAKRLGQKVMLRDGVRITPAYR